MDWDDLRVFLTMQSVGSVSRTAETLQLNHSTVLRRLSRLEESLNVRLFERLPSGYALTGAGEELIDYLNGVTEQIESAQRQIAGQDREIRGTIRLTSTDTLFEGLLTPYLAEFRRRHPKIQLQLTMNNSFMSLTKREADIAVRGSNRPPENLIGRNVGRIQTALYASKKYLAARPADLALNEYEWVGPDESLAHLEQAKWLRANVALDRIVVRMDSLLGMAACVKNGMGVGLLLCPLAEGDADLVRLAPPDESLDTQIWVLTHPDLKRVARIKALTDFLYEKLSADPRLVRDSGRAG